MIDGWRDRDQTKLARLYRAAMGWLIDLPPEIGWGGSRKPSNEEPMRQTDWYARVLGSRGDLLGYQMKPLRYLLSEGGGVQRETTSAEGTTYLFGEKTCTWQAATAGFRSGFSPADPTSGRKSVLPHHPQPRIHKLVCLPHPLSFCPTSPLINTELPDLRLACKPLSSHVPFAASQPGSGNNFRD